MVEYTHYDFETHEKDLIIKAIEIAKLKLSEDPANITDVMKLNKINDLLMGEMYLSVSTTGLVLEDD